ncbi:MAG: cellulase family glycosylhydrolase [Microthrixaceae bacterium]
MRTAGRVDGRRRAAVAALTATMIAAALLAAACSSPPLVTFPSGSGVITPARADVVGPLTLRGRDLLDAEGRVVLIHGTNVVTKSPPFHATADGALAPAQLAAMRRDGLNGVRLGVWPAALMPAPGVVDTAYLEEIAANVATLTDAGMWVLLDLHQDVFTGMPAWATTPEAAALPDLVGGAEGASWALAYASPRSLRQWDDWWAQVPVAGGRSAIDWYGDGVAALASRFRDEPNVIGIDPLNEPFAGSAFLDCVGTCGDRYRAVEAMHRSFTDKVRAVAPAMNMWWEPFTIGTPFPGTPDPGPGVGHNFHAYCLGTDSGKPEQPPAEASALCDGLFTSIFDAADDLRARWDAPAMLTEFGASASPLNSTRTTQIADERLISWFHWAWGNYPEVVRTNLVRTSAQATAGTPTLQRFDPATGAYELRFTPDPSVTAPTSIIAPTEVYPAGYAVAVDGGTVTSPAAAGRITVAADPGATSVVVRVTRRTP